jgi:hypothetical protein
MKKITYTDGTVDVELTDDEAVVVCGIGKGEGCCKFLIMSSDGFECGRMSGYNINTSHAKGEGGWKGCVWEDEI